MLKLIINKTMNYIGEIIIDEIVVKTLTQNFNELGIRNGAIGEYISNKDLYFKNIEACRVQEDEFIKQMREIEDVSLKKDVVI